MSLLDCYLLTLLRYLNGYGDPALWGVQKTPATTILSFLNVTKYPCSLDYLCMTLGAGIFLLAVFERMSNSLTRLFSVYGSVPFFYYVLHFMLIRTFDIVVFYILGFKAIDIPARPGDFSFHPAAFGFPLWGIYLVWLIVISTLYLPCRWFSRYKKDHKSWWLSYL